MQSRKMQAFSFFSHDMIWFLGADETKPWDKDMPGASRMDPKSYGLSVETPNMLFFNFLGIYQSLLSGYRPRKMRPKRQKDVGLGRHRGCGLDVVPLLPMFLDCS